MKAIVFSLCAVLGIFAELQSQTLCNGVINPSKQELRTNVNIPNTDVIKGYAEHVPSDYWFNSTRFYPLVIFVHGWGDTGNGSADDLCKLFNPTMNYPTAMIERGTWPTEMVNSNGRAFPFITLSPQFTQWDYSEVAIGEFILYAIRNYRVDADRIYLIGASQGAEVIQKYIGANDSNAKNIAAIVPMAACKYITPWVAENIGKNKTGVWTSQCVNDRMCDANAALTNRNLINSYSSDNRVVLSNFPEDGYSCLQDPHDTWSILLDPNYKKNVNGQSMNIFDFMIAHSAGTTLPVQLLSFDVSLRNNQPFLQWKTGQEIDGYLFYIERAREGENFQRIDSIYTRNSATGSDYDWTDRAPVNGRVQYRLAQMDKDGFIQYSNIKTILFNDKNEIIIRQNPFTQQLNFDIYDNSQQQLTVRIADINGKVLYQQAYQLTDGRISLSVRTEQWPAGLYIIQYGSKVKKVMKQ